MAVTESTPDTPHGWSDDAQGGVNPVEPLEDSRRAKGTVAPETSGVSLTVILAGGGVGMDRV